jgi:glycogen operon protein
MSEPALRRRKYFQGRSIRGGKDVAWLAPDGHEMTDSAWHSTFVRSIGMLLSGVLDELSEHGEPIVGDTLLILMNANHDKISFSLPNLEPDQQWQRVFDTIAPRLPERAFRPGARYSLQGRSVSVFKVTPPLLERRRGLLASRIARPEQAPVDGTPDTPPDSPADIPEPVPVAREHWIPEGTDL